MNLRSSTSSPGAPQASADDARMITVADLARDVPPFWAEDPRPEILAILHAGAPLLVVIDDDPTGTQTVHDITLVTDWSVPVLRRALASRPETLFVLTNSRSLTATDAQATVCEVTKNVRLAIGDRRFTICSRSDSTLRGHFEPELNGIAAGLGDSPDLILVAPAFFDGGRYTARDIHYLRSGAGLIPVSESNFAHDETFGYRHSNLRDWIEEKTGGRIAARSVRSLALELIRSQGAIGVGRALRALPSGSFVVVNALERRDLDTVALAALRCEQDHRRLLYRTAASFVAARAGLGSRALLTAADLGLGLGRPGIVMVGSYVANSTRQVQQLLQLPAVAGVELSVAELLGGCAHDCIASAVGAATAAFRRGRTAVIYTSRTYFAGGKQALDQGRRISDALVEVFRRLPDGAFVVAKGGITSHEIATRGLGIVQAEVRGRLVAGVPVWTTGPGGPPLVVFPGNVGDDHSLAEVVAALHGPVVS